jgi:hypothetical protein
MFKQSIKPLARSLSTRAAPAARSPRSLYLGTLAATTGLAFVTYSTLSREVRNDTTGSGNYKPSVKQYNEDLKVNRHKSQFSGIFGIAVRTELYLTLRPYL